jgi:SAM-dependent methyltransferase
MSERVHSEDFFGETRDHWWHQDFLELMARRWRLADASRVLDAGCGFGHWGQRLASVLPADCRLVGVDPEEKSVARAAERARERGLGARFEYRRGSAEALDFPDASFDVATCQTLLIHVKDPRAVLKEMSRVLKPDGLLAVVEPNNLANSLVQDGAEGTLEERLDFARLQGRCERGKAKLGLGDNSVGDLVPGLLAELGLERIQVHLSDKAGALVPPYAAPEQQAALRELRRWAAEDFLLWSREETRRYFSADGGGDEEFAALWEKLRAARRRFVERADSGRAHTAGGQLLYLISARKAPGLGARIPKS